MDNNDDACEESKELVMFLVQLIDSRTEQSSNI